MPAENFHAYASDRDASHGQVSELLIRFCTGRRASSLPKFVSINHAESESKVDEQSIGSCETKRVAIHYRRWTLSSGQLRDYLLAVVVVVV